MMLDTVQHCGDPIRPNRAFEHGRPSSGTQRERDLVIRDSSNPSVPRTLRLSPSALAPTGDAPCEAHIGQRDGLRRHGFHRVCD